MFIRRAVCVSVCVCVCVLLTTVSAVKTAAPSDMPFGGRLAWTEGRDHYYMGPTRAQPEEYD